MLPISNAQLLDENEMLLKMKPKDVISWANIWLAEYNDLPKEVIQQLDPETKEKFESKYLLAQRISRISETEDLQSVNLPVASTSRQATNVTAAIGSDSSTAENSAPATLEAEHHSLQSEKQLVTSTSCQATNVTAAIGSDSSTGENPAPATLEAEQHSLQSEKQLVTSTSCQATNFTAAIGSDSSTATNPAPATLVSPNPANQLNDEPCTSTTATRCTKRRISYDAYNADPRKRVMREMNREVYLSDRSTNAQCDDHVAPSGGASVITSTQTNIVDSSNNRSEEIQATTPTPAPSPPMASSTPLPMPPPSNDRKAVGYIVIGPNGTQVPSDKFKTISFTSFTAATRSLLCMIFTEEILATNTLTGKPSPAFVGRERPSKGKLDPKKVEDIIQCVIFRTSCTAKEVRWTITTKCADSAKKFRRLSMTRRN
ncbi:uncharacterized protein LOC128922256 [Zeugodacus cucurbitae]|uniref:uncharacterized protein LOC128922256 n=1 Tax=Zeugodacus cucurbitae TaxID=28588 RepID=UPI0023D938E2|nr:uncharacterized protein LOC128922256 [Zeugodacus cucurbitae]